MIVSVAAFTTLKMIDDKIIPKIKASTSEPPTIAPTEPSPIDDEDVVAVNRATTTAITPVPSPMANVIMPSTRAVRLSLMMAVQPRSRKSVSTLCPASM
eukprot:CAMPEP_0176302084 /NCGR_PEP_ID=MMETSP0121_2-20121125/61196_1 /TAXON_ID=160619 /ORGANISM="Kryptoperidinium foliaceum, Strain CCMP 1326" /LENGTH=98 /DNA_ID=CAMNT_0017643575 /DNA_START=127 /DNA_END=423 /DNA_ORIENTATION=+